MMNKKVIEGICWAVLTGAGAISWIEWVKSDRKLHKVKKELGEARLAAAMGTLYYECAEREMDRLKKQIEELKAKLNEEN